MKKIIALSFTICFFAMQGISQKGNYNSDHKSTETWRLIIDSTLHIPAGCGAPGVRVGAWTGSGSIYADTCTNKLYLLSSGAWRDVTGLASGVFQDTTYNQNDTLIGKKNGLPWLIYDLTKKLNVADSITKYVTPTQLNGINNQKFGLTDTISNEDRYFKSKNYKFTIDSAKNIKLFQRHTIGNAYLKLGNDGTDVNNGFYIGDSSASGQSKIFTYDLGNDAEGLVIQNINPFGTQLQLIFMNGIIESSVAKVVNFIASDSSKISTPSSFVAARSDSSVILSPKVGRLYANNLVADAGTKALRYNTSTGKITYSDTSTGGGSSTLSGLTDVNISSPSNLQLLQYQTGDSKWHNFTPNYLAASDTSNKWVNNITRTPGKDSIIFYVGSTRYAIKDSVGTGGGGGGTWGSITGTLSSQTDLQTALDAKEPTITASNTVKKYWNGYKQWVALNSDSLTEGSTNLFYTNARARSALSFTAGSGGYNSSTGVITIPTNTNQLTNGAGFLSSIDTSNISNFSTKVRSLLSASAPLSYNSGTGAFSISQANTSTNGYLSNTDWNTFNNKFTLPSLTSGSVLFSNGTTIAQDNSNLFWDNTNKRLGIKVNNPVYTLQVRGDAYLDSSQLTVNMSNYDKGITVNQWGGGSGYFKINSASSGGMLPAFNAKSTYAGTGIMFIVSGNNTYSDGAIVFSGRNAAGTGSITGGTLVDFKNYTTSYLNIDYTGRVGIGVTSPTGVVHIKAGTATAGTAPLKFTAGTNLTTTEAGAVEFDGTHLYFTATNGGTRYQLDQQSGGASALSGLTDVNVSSPSNLQLLQYQTGDSKWHNWTPNYITGNQTITLSGDATGSGATSISTTVGKINGTSLAGLATGILKNTTGTGVPSIAVAGDFPTLNQNTTGSAATLTTTRTIWGQNFNGSANVTGNITLGTSNITMTGSIASTGSRVTKGWFTNLESSNVPTVGGTSLTTLSQTFQNKTLTNSNNVLGGVTMTLGSDANYDIYYRNNSGVLTRLAAGTDGQVLTTHSTTSAPTWTTVSGSTQNLSWNSGTHAVDISGGGTSAVIPLATSSINGLSSSTDKAFLDSLRSHNSYIRNSIAIGDSLLTKKNDSTLIARRLSLTAGDNMTIATTGSNDSLLKYTIDVKNDTTALFTFGAGSGASGDTTAFSTSALYGSFYNAGSDSLIITSINAVMQGSNDTLKISVCFSDTLKAVSPSYVLNSYSINNNSVGKNATSGDFTTAKIPPGKHVYCLSPYVLAGRKPTYLSVTVIGYKKRKL